MSGLLQTSSGAGGPARHGSTLVEVLVACLILAIVVLGTAASLTFARTGVSVQRNRLTAMELANSRMEELRTAPYAALAPPVLSCATSYVDRISGSWHLSATDPGETVLIGAQSHPLRTTVEYMDADAGSVSYDCLRLTVSIVYDRGAADVVSLQTIRSP